MPPPFSRDIAAYKTLPAEESARVAKAIATLTRMMAQGDISSPNKLKLILEETGNFDIAMDCYAAELLGEPWR